MIEETVDRGAEFRYPARDFLCLSCVVPGGCKPYTAMCLWRADRSEDPNPREVQLLYAVKDLARRRRLPSVRELAQLLGVSPTAVSARIERAVEAGLLARGCAHHDRQGVSVTALGERRLLEVENRRPELELNPLQRRYYHLLATLRDLQEVGPVSATMLASAVGRGRPSTMRSLRALEELALVEYDRGWIELADAGRHLLKTLRAYAVNVRLGPRVLIRARGRLRYRYLTRKDAPPVRSTGSVAATGSVASTGSVVSTGSVAATGTVVSTGSVGSTGSVVADTDPGEGIQAEVDMP
jgi:Mn-dependent DtxR family transcriptional regulator